MEELELAPKPVRDLLSQIPIKHRDYVSKTDQITELADEYLSEGAVSNKFYEDALHIATATICKVDVLISWNFKHIANLTKIRLYNSVNLRNGYPVIEIRTPREVLKTK